MKCMHTGLDNIYCRDVLEEMTDAKTAENIKELQKMFVIRGPKKWMAPQRYSRGRAALGPHFLGPCA